MESGSTSPFSSPWQLPPKTHAKGNEVRHGGKVLRNSLQSSSAQSSAIFWLWREGGIAGVPCFDYYISLISVWSVVWLHLYSRIYSYIVTVEELTV